MALKSGKAAVALAAAIAAAAGVYGLLGGGDAPAGTDPADAALVALGERVYGEACAACHGARLEGQPDWRSRKADGTLPAPPHDETGHTWHHPDRDLFAYTKFGGAKLAPPGFKSAMPGFAETLTDRDIWAVLSFIKSRWPERERAHQTRITRKGG